MAPKRRREVDASAAEGKAVKKSATRASTRIAAQPEKPTAVAESTTTKPQLRKTKTQIKDKTKAAPAKAIKPTKTKAAKPKTTPSKIAAINNIENITIESPDIKNPVQCQKYASTGNNDPQKTLIFTHGAGGTIEAPAVVNFCTGFSTTLPVLTFQGSMNLPSRAKAFHVCISHLDATDQQQNHVLSGRSMGARAAVMAATKLVKDTDSKSTQPSIQLILVSYPLKGPKDDIRDQILLDLPGSVKVLFVIGDRDAMCPLDMLETVREKMRAKNEIVIIYGADHGMHLLAKDKEDGNAEKELGEKAGKIAAEWVVRGSLEGGEEAA